MATAIAETKDVLDVINEQVEKEKSGRLDTLRRLAAMPATGLTQKEVKQFRTEKERWNFTDEEIRRHRALLAEEKRLLAIVETIPALSRETGSAFVVANKFHDEMTVKIQKLQDQHAALLGTAHAAKIRQDQAERARERLITLRQSAYEFFAVEPPIDTIALQMGQPKSMPTPESLRLALPEREGQSKIPREPAGMVPDGLQPGDARIHTDGTRREYRPNAIPVPGMTFEQLAGDLAVARAAAARIDAAYADPEAAMREVMADDDPPESGPPEE